MKRAEELFTFVERSSRSPLIGETWQTHSVPEQVFISIAVTQWEMVVTRQRGTARLTVRGPETRAKAAPIPQDAEMFGIPFNLGTYLPGLPPERLVDGSVTLPQASDNSFWLDGSVWELPGPDNADVFVERLVRAGLLVHDPVAAAAVRGDAGDDDNTGGNAGDVAGLSTRSVERRVLRATGLTRGAIRQIRRAERAVELLTRGVPALDVARRTGYADQPHLSRSLRRFVGQTPSRIAASAPGE